MSVTLALLAAHALGDFPFQTDRMAKEKLTDRNVRMQHSLIHGLLAWALLVIVTGPVNAAGASSAIIALHFVIDSRRWVSEDAGGFDGFPMAVDQTLHLTSLYLVSVVILS